MLLLVVRALEHMSNNCQTDISDCWGLRAVEVCQRYVPLHKCSQFFSHYVDTVAAGTVLKW